MATTVTSKGQVTIPKPIRDYLGIEPGSEVEFPARRMTATSSLKGPMVRGRRAVLPRRVGSAGPGMTTDELMELLRGEPE